MSHGCTPEHRCPGKDDGSGRMPAAPIATCPLASTEQASPATSQAPPPCTTTCRADARAVTDPILHALPSPEHSWRSVWYGLTVSSPLPMCTRPCATRTRNSAVGSL